MATPKWKAVLENRKKMNDAQEVKAFNLPDGKTTLRILPNPTSEEEMFFVDFGEHWIKSSTEKNAQGKPKILGVPLCLAKAYEEQCPYCDAISEAERHMEDNRHDFTDEEVELISGAKSRHRVLVNAAIRVGNSYEVKMVNLPTTAFNQLIELISEYGEDVVKDVDGLDVAFTRSGTGINTKYTVMPARNHGEDIVGWKEKAVDLQAYLKSRLLDPARAATAISGVGATAGLSLSAPAISGALSAPASTSTTPPASTGKYASDEGEVDDSLESELDDIPFETDAVVTTPKAAEQVEEGSDDDDLLSSLDELEDL